MNHVTSDESEQKAILSDPLCYNGGVKCKWATATHECLVVIIPLLFSFSRGFSRFQSRSTALHLIRRAISRRTQSPFYFPDYRIQMAS